MYGVYDTLNNDLCMGIFNIIELAKYFKTTKASMHSTICRKNKVKHRYEIYKITED